MNFANLIQIALRALSNNKTRCLLTMLGIIIGVSSVITMMFLGESQKQNIRAEIGGMGTNLIIIRPEWRQRGGAAVSAADLQCLKEGDYEAITNEAGYVSSVSPYVGSSGQAIVGANNAPTTVKGCSEQLAVIENYTVEEGAMWGRNEVRTAAKVCVLSAGLYRKLFPNGENPVGQNVRLETIPLKIVGTLKEKGGEDDNFMYVPYTTVQRRMNGIRYLNAIYASAATEEVSAAAVDEIKAIVRDRHNIRKGDADDFEVMSMTEMLESLNEILGILTMVLSCIAGISLVVGGIGIMNIMYVSVTERTREIGLRMSIGAKSRHIMMQFLIESVIISIAGGLIGVALGISFASLIIKLLDWPFIFDGFAIVVSFVVCTATGVFFGWYPARKAGNLNPIDALRYE
ncbi:ABC transporter permease [Alistipes sp. Z76]|nr:ABC transporter permease [Alistipes sp. Z76]NCE69083.1 ABC transporter permease [Muribaculaceae bacterium M3]